MPARRHDSHAWRFVPRLREGNPDDPTWLLGPTAHRIALQPFSTIAVMRTGIGVWPVISAIILLHCCTSFGQLSEKHEVVPPVPTNIHQLFLDDQSDRNGDHNVAAYGQDVTTRDAKRRAQTKALIATGELKTSRDFHDAAYIFQHGDEANDYLLAHILSVEAVVKGDESSKWIAAASLDRYLQAIGKSQVFGTQYLDKSYLYALQHKNEPNLQNKPEANEKGMTQEPYERDLVPDSLRNDFCVPDLAQQRINLEVFQSGNYPSGIIPSGCTR